MRALLDTHALLWWLTGSPKLSRKAKALIADERTTVLISAASAWEIATKIRKGQLPEAAEAASDVARAVLAQGFQPLAVTLRHGQRAGALPGPMKDPFDRMLVAQSQAEGVPLISIEEVFDKLEPVRKAEFLLHGIELRANQKASGQYAGVEIDHRSEVSDPLDQLRHRVIGACSSCEAAHGPGPRAGPDPGPGSA